MKCILHIGAHKTGTTSIQSALDGYDDGQNFFANLGNPNHSFAFQTLFSDDLFANHWKTLGEDPLEQFRLYDEQLRLALEEDREVIIFSGENISYFDENQYKKMRDRLSQSCSSFEVIFYIREPLQWAASFGQQIVRHGRQESDYRIPSFKERYAKLLSAFSPTEIRFLKYEDKNRFSGDIVLHFFDALGLKLAQNYNHQTRLNAGISMEAVRVLRIVNEELYPINRGEILQRAHWKFVGEVARLFPRNGRIDALNFLNFLKFEDYKFLRECAGIEYAVPEEATSSTHCELKDTDLSGIHEVVNRYIFDAGFPREKPTNLAVSLAYMYAFFIAEELNENGIVISDKTIDLRKNLEEQRDAALEQARQIAEDRNNAAEKANRLTMDINARRSRIAFYIDFLDYWIHMYISKIPFFSSSFRKKFSRGAEKRFRECYIKEASKDRFGST
ncbi:sulfotransferase family protein [Ruegeria atlantica]|uniref:Uncharacterized protein n=1 Tax=Ruegeria atlantica TaxID=81569 RepID=A0A0P1E8K0_9RHOB|nr:sulfotransferase family protein [Ruegeria atlantica]CUH45426.1 hypothetical protein RUM4293_04340 [Ruegeria atlantica]